MRLTLLYLFLLIYTCAQSQQVTSISIGNQQNEEVGTIQPLSNGDYLVVGQILFKNNRSDAIISRLDSSFKTIWSSVIDNATADRAWSALELKNGNILLTTTSSGDRSNNDYTYLSLLNGQTGQIEWTEQRGGNQDRLPYMKELDDGSLLLAGMLEGETGSSWNKFTLVKRRADFSVEWQYYYNHLVPSALESPSGEIGVVDNIIEQTDGYILLGNHSQVGRRGMRLLKVDKSGNFMWLRQFHFPLNYRVRHIVPFTKSGIEGFLVAGGYAEQRDGLGVGILTFLDSEGKHIWTKNYVAGKNADLRYIAVTNDGCAVAVGSSEGLGLDGKNMFAIKINDEGNLVWGKVYGGDADDEGERVYYTNGVLLMSGNTWSTPNGNRDIYIIKTDSAGDISRECMRDVTEDVYVFSIKPIEISSVYKRGSVGGPASVSLYSSIYVMSNNDICASCADMNLGLQGETKSICDGSPLVLRLPPIKGEYYWSTGQTGQRIAISDTGQYWLKAINECDTATDTFYVDSRMRPTIPDLKDTVVCYDDSITFSISPTDNHDYVWLPYDSIADKISLPAGDYSLISINNCGLLREDFNIRSVGDYDIKIPDRTECLYNTSTIDLSSQFDTGINIYWHHLADSSPIIILYDSGTYYLTTERCEIVKNYSFRFNWSSQNVYIPSAFTPNQQGPEENNVFKVGSYVLSNNFNMQIFNRWGELIFTTDNPLKGWDGNYRGKPAPEGVYLYIVRAKDCDGLNQYIKGSVTLIR